MAYSIYETYDKVYVRLDNQQFYFGEINGIEYKLAYIYLNDSDLHNTVYEIDYEYEDEEEKVGVILKTDLEIDSLSLFLLFKQKRIFVFHEDYANDITQIVGRLGNESRGSFFNGPYQNYRLVTLKTYMDYADGVVNIVPTLERLNPVKESSLTVTENTVNVTNSAWMLYEGDCILLKTTGMSQSEHANISIYEWGNTYPKFWYIKLASESPTPIYFHNSFRIKLNSVYHTPTLPNITISVPYGRVDIVLVQEDESSPVSGFVL